MYACVSWASAVKTYTLVHVLQLFSVMKPSSMNQKKRWAKDWAFFWKMNGRFVVRARPYITPRSSVPREETQTHNTQPKFCFYDHNTTVRQFPDKTNRTSKGNVLGSSTKSCESAGARIIRGSATATQQKPRIRQSNIHSGAKGHNPARKVVTRFFEDSIEMGTRDRVAVRARSHVCWTMGCTAGWGAHWVIV